MHILGHLNILIVTNSIVDWKALIFPSDPTRLTFQFPLLILS